MSHIDLNVFVFCLYLEILIIPQPYSFFVCYITRFTEECFACLIAIIFVIKVSQHCGSKNVV